MIKTLFDKTGNIVELQHCQQFFCVEVFVPKRLVFVDKPNKDIPSLQDTNKPKKDDYRKLRSDNIDKALLELVDKKKISDAQYEDTLKILDSGNRDENETLIRNTELYYNNRLSKNGYALALNRSLKKLKIEPTKEGEKIEESTADSGKKLEHVTAPNPIDEIRSEISHKIRSLIESTENLLIIAESQKPASDGDRLNRIRKLRQELHVLNDLDKAAGKETKKILQELLETKKLTNQQANAIYIISPATAGFDENWKKIMASFKDPDVIAKLEQILKAKKTDLAEIIRIQQDYEKRRQEQIALLSEMNHEIHVKTEQERAKEMFNRRIGFTVEPEKKLRYIYFREILDSNGELQDYKKTYRYATIKKIEFPEMEIQDDTGKILQKVPAYTPTITLEWEDIDTKEKDSIVMDGAKFAESVDHQDICEIIEDKKDIEQSLGDAVVEGETLEYREIDFGTANGEEKDKKVQILNIDETKKEITLSSSVLTATYPSPRREEKLSYGAFLKWYRRSDVVKPIASLEVLRQRLKDEQARRNLKYPDSSGQPRNSKEYPHIEAIAGEALYQDVHPPAEFIIQSIDEEKVVLNNGMSFTLANFLRWVQKYEIEKLSPEAEAHKASEKIKDEQAKAEVFDAVKKQVIKDIDDKKKKKLEDENPQAFNSKPVPLPSVSKLRKMWNKTYFLSIDDIWEMGKEDVEFFKRALHRDKEGRIALVGEHLHEPITELASEYLSREQKHEHEEVSRIEEAYKHLGPDKLWPLLYDAPTRFHLRAAMNMLAEKGLLHWEDELLWRAINRLSFGRPRWVRSEDDLEPVIDSFWGNHTFLDYKGKNGHAYDSKKNGFTEEAKQLEADPQQNGGLHGALQRILYHHMHGEIVNPPEYESYLHYAIEGGKLGFEDKLYFLIMGLTIRGKGHDGFPGNTLLSMERLSTLDSTLLNKFPILDYFATKSFPQFDHHGHPKMVIENGRKVQARGNISYWNMLQIVNTYILPQQKLDTVSHYAELNPPAKFKEFIERVMIWDNRVQVRLAEKSSRDASNWDHDDLDNHAPHLGEETIEQITAKEGGAKQNVSVAGVKNAFVGLNHFTYLTMNMFQQALANKDSEGAHQNIDRMIKILRTFIRLHAIVDRRFYHEKDRTRLSDVDLAGNAVTDSKKSVWEHINQLQVNLGEISNRLGLGEDWRKIMKKSGISEKEQSEVIRKFGTKLSGALHNYAVDHTNDQNLKANSKIDLHGYNALNELFTDAQKTTGIEINGKVGKRVKAEAQEIPLSQPFRPYTDDDLQQKVEEFLRLQKQLEGKPERNSAQRDSDQKNRLESIIQRVQKGKLLEVKDDDVKLLDDQLKKLRGETQRKLPQDENFEQQAA